MALLLRGCFRLTIPLKRFKPCNYIESLTRSQSSLFYSIAVYKPVSSRNICRVSSYSCRSFSNAANDGKSNHEPKLGLVARFKQMYRDYWYVLMPVHVVTSICWFGGFYYMAKSGVDVIALLKSMGLSDKFTDPLKDSSMGYVALAYALYKIATPVRYTVTLGGTTISIKYLRAWGYIKPMPSKEKLREIYVEKKLELKHRKQQFTDRRDHVMSDIAKYKQEMQNVKDSETKNK